MTSLSSFRGLYSIFISQDQATEISGQIAFDGSSREESGGKRPLIFLGNLEAFAFFL